MANTAGIIERTLAQMATATDTVNVLDPDGDPALVRTSIDQHMIVRATNHDDDDGSTGAVTEGMAIFLSRFHGDPWVRVGHQVTKIIYPPTASPSPGTDVSVLFVNYDYSSATWAMLT
jgi:hypothetical protein|tara:strand:+ start:1705 stop:2058 length:354 start_codon:yes stop_codon:yes gene_type:complete